MLTGPNPLGLNLYVYCYNNPIQFSDHAGKIPEDAIFRSLLGDMLRFGNAVKEMRDHIESRKDNDSVEVVKEDLEAKGVSVYKGATVFKADILGGSALSFGVILMGGQTLSKPNFEDTLNHEYGHYVHFQQIGAIDYFFTVAIPSLTFAYLSGKSETISDRYHDLPWENIADQLGGVTSNDYLPGSIENGMAFYQMTLIYSQLTIF